MPIENNYFKLQFVFFFPTGGIKWTIDLLKYKLLIIINNNTHMICYLCFI